MSTPNHPSPASHAPPAPTARTLKIGEQHPQLFAVVRDKLRERILSGEFTPGDRLVEGRLSDEMGVSRIPVREALRALASEGLVTIEPRRGASVSVLSDDVAHDMIEVRATLEGLNAKLAAQRRDQATVGRLQAFLAEGNTAARTDSLERFLALNSEFHEMLATIAGNVVLTDLMRSLRDRTALLFAPSNMRRARQNWDEHAQILNAVIAGNGDLAALLASQHVHNAAKAYVEAQQQKSAAG
ncbi:GntR family transcriptional regulator [Bordetella genomosp. 11]|uniref:GntR family transcriptional regulator n=2 Tax=Bordetella genomosp. 11 TaxID=1416808 RepID=A0A261ULF6_9BORD|nr:GntR family transcriptional regulator [Bordetella genomosp. 11]